MKIGFIGCGNMGSALASAAIKTVGCKDIYISDFLPEKAQEFCNATGANVSSNEEIAKECDYISPWFQWRQVFPFRLLKK